MHMLAVTVVSPIQLLPTMLIMLPSGLATNCKNGRTKSEFGKELDNCKTYQWILRYLSKKGCKLVVILRDYFVKTKSQTHRDCIITKFANSVNTYAHTYGHHILCAFRELHEH